MSLRDKALSGLLWSAVDKWGSKAFSFLVFLVLARLLQPSAFGLVALASAYVSLVQVLVGQGLVPALVQREHLDERHLDTAFWANATAALAMATLSFVLARPVASVLNEPALAPVVRALSPCFVLAGFSSVQQPVVNNGVCFLSVEGNQVNVASQGISNSAV